MPGAVFDIAIAGNLPDIASMREGWDRLNDQAPGGNPFTSHAWMTHWCKFYLGKHLPRVITVRINEKLVGIAPLYLSHSHGIGILQLLGQKEVHADNIGFIIEPGLEDEVGKASCQRSSRRSIAGMRSLSMGSGTTVPFRMSFFPRTRVCWRRLVGVEMRSWQGKKGSGVILKNSAFIGELLPRLIESRRSDIVWIYKDALPVAFVLYFTSCDRAYSKVAAYDEDFEKLSLGNIAHYYAWSAPGKQGINRVDLGTDIGPSLSKDRWTEHKEVSYRHVFVRRTLRGRAAAVSQLMRTPPKRPPASLT